VRVPPSGYSRREQSQMLKRGRHASCRYAPTAAIGEDIPLTDLLVLAERCRMGAMTEDALLRSGPDPLWTSRATARRVPVLATFITACGARCRRSRGYVIECAGTAGSRVGPENLS
jgi:hypothetical protein